MKMYEFLILLLAISLNLISQVLGQLQQLQKYVQLGYLNKDIYQNMSAEIGVRRNIQTLQPSERKQYFWCLKMLSILPPFKANKDRFFFSFGLTGPNWPSSNPYNKIEPMCLYDELIASHATSCEHMSFYFAYYHRHLMFYFQVLLNYVDEVLRAEEEDSFQVKFSYLYNPQKQRWDVFLKDYRGLPKKKVMAHYWNPTNYNSRNDIIIPFELSDPKLYGYKYDILDQIFNQIRGHYPHQVNVQKRWYNSNYKKEEFIHHMKNNFPYFYDGYTFTSNEEQMISGDLNPRTQGKFNLFFDTYKSFTNFIDDKHINNSMKMTSSRNLDLFNNSGKMSLFGQKEGQMLINMGGRFDSTGKPHNMHYFDEKELDQTDLTVRVEQINYNKMNPHYQLGYALYNKQFEHFVDYINLVKTGKHLEKSHNTMHNNMHFSMIDSNFSLCNMAFFLYHSWIDIQLEMKIRMCQTPLEAHLLKAELLRVTQKNENLFDLILANGRTKGEYPIMEWCNPIYISYIKSNSQLTAQQKERLIKQFRLADTIQVAFPAMDYYLNRSAQGDIIRSSKDLKQFYNQHYINQFNINRLAQYKGFKNYNASYDIEIFETHYDQKKSQFQDRIAMLGELRDGSLYIPSYLQAMKNQVNSEDIFLVNFTKNYIEKVQNPCSLNYYLRLVQKNLLLHVKYRSTTPNGNYLVKASFKSLLDLLIKKKYQVTQTQYSLNHLPKQDIGVLAITIFGKGVHAKQCLKCGQSKNMVINMGEQLFSRHKCLWAFVNLVLTRKVIYDSYQPNKYIAQDQQVDLSKVLAVKNTPNQFVFEYIQGAQQALFDIEFISSKAGQPQDFRLSIELKIKSTQTSQPTSVAFKEIENQDLQKDKCNQKYTYRFDFYNLKESSPNTKRGDLDGLIYSEVTVNVFANNRSLNFTFPIKNYHEIIRHKVVVIEDQNEQALHAIIQDADYDYKIKLYREGLLIGK